MPRVYKIMIAVIVIIAAIITVIIKYIMPENPTAKAAIDAVKNAAMNILKPIEKRIYDTLISEGMLPATALMVVAQTKFETALNGKEYASNVFKTLNNICGYKKVVGNKYQIDGGTMSPEGNSYAKYATIEDSAKDLAAWYRNRKKKDGKDFDKVAGNFTYFAELLYKEPMPYYTKMSGKTDGQTVATYADGLRKYFKPKI